MRKQTKANQHRWQRTKYETLQPLKKKYCTVTMSRSWPSHLTSLSLILSICNISITVVLSSCFEIK